MVRRERTDRRSASPKSGWPDQVVGTAIVVERILLPPSAEAELGAKGDDRTHRSRRRASGASRGSPRRCCSADGRRMCAIRLRDKDSDDDVLTGVDLLPGLTDALALTLD